MKKAEIRKPLFEMTEDILFPLGFIKQKNSEGFDYIKYNKYGFIKIFPTIWQYDTLFYISLGFSLRVDEISKILIFINNISDEFKNEYSTLNFGIDSLIKIDDNRIKVETPEELTGAISILKNVLEDQAMTFINSINSVSDLDKELNRENRQKDLYCSEVSVRPFAGLSSAVLNNNPRSKYWENYYREKLQNANQHIKNQYEKLVSYLKNNFLDYK